MKINKLYEEYLIEMAIPRKDALSRVEGLSKPLMIHTNLLGVFGKKAIEYEHWKKEIASLCEQIDTIKVKKSEKLDSDDFRNFFFHLDTDKDAELEVFCTWIEHKMGPVSDINFTREDYHRLKLFRNDCFEELAELFADKKDHSKEFFQEFIEDKVNKYF